MPRPNDQTGLYERPHEDWSGPMQRIGPPAMPPRYAAGNYSDWSGPLERIDPAAPPSQYGAPPSQYGADGQYGGRGQSGRPGAEPRYERTGEIDRSGQYERPDYDQPQRDQPQRDQAQYVQAQYVQRQYERPRDEQSQYDQAQYGPPVGQSSFPAAQSGGSPRYAPAPYGYAGQPGQPMPHQQDQSGGYERPHPDPYQPPQYQPGRYPPAQYPPAQHDPGLYQYQPPAGYESGDQPGQYQAPLRDEELMQYDQYQRGPDGRSGRYGRPESDAPERAAHYASFADQDATYTRPRPAGARDEFSAQDETDPLNIVPLNIGNYS